MSVPGRPHPPSQLGARQRVQPSPGPLRDVAGRGCAGRCSTRRARPRRVDSQRAGFVDRPSSAGRAATSEGARRLRKVRDGRTASVPKPAHSYRSRRTPARGAAPTQRVRPSPARSFHGQQARSTDDASSAGHAASAPVGAVAPIGVRAAGRAAYRHHAEFDVRLVLTMIDQSPVEVGGTSRRSCQPFRVSVASSPRRGETP